MAYISMRFFYPKHFEMVQQKKLAQHSVGATNTLVLLTSSLTMALAVRAAQMLPMEKNEEKIRKSLMNYLLVTTAFAAMFLVIKYIEYSHKIHDGLLPGKFYSYDAWQAQITDNNFAGVVGEERRTHCNRSTSNFLFSVFHDDRCTWPARFNRCWRYFMVVSACKTWRV